MKIARERLAKARVLVVGDAMLDRYWFGAVDRISPEAPVPVVLVTREEERLGGAANVALNVKTLGAQATLLTVVGDDEPARKLRHLLARHRAFEKTPAGKAGHRQYRLKAHCGCAANSRSSRGRRLRRAFRA